jgi:hypothetical protein
MQLLDLIPVKDPKGGSPKTPPRGIPLSEFKRYMAHSERPSEPNGSSWVALRDYFTLWLERLEVFYDRRFQDLEAKTTLALANSDKAVDKSDAATEKRFEGVNELRGALSDQAATFIPRSEYLANHQAVQRDIESLAKEFRGMRESDSNRIQDSSRYKQGWIVPMFVVATIATLNLIINLFWMLKR